MDPFQALSMCSYLPELNIQSIYFPDSIYFHTCCLGTLQAAFEEHKEYVFQSKKSIRDDAAK